MRKFMTLAAAALSSGGAVLAAAGAAHAAVGAAEASCALSGPASINAAQFSYDACDSQNDTIHVAADGTSLVAPALGTATAPAAIPVPANSSAPCACAPVPAIPTPQIPTPAVPPQVVVPTPPTPQIPTPAVPPQVVVPTPPTPQISTPATVPCPPGSAPAAAAPATGNIMAGLPITGQSLGGLL